MEDYNIIEEKIEEIVDIEEENLYYINSKLRNIENSLELSVISNNKYNDKLEDISVFLAEIDNNQFKNFIYYNNTISPDNTISLNTGVEFFDENNKTIINSFDLDIAGIKEKMINSRILCDKKIMILLYNDNKHLQEELDLTVVIKDKDTNKVYEINIKESFFDKKVIYLGKLFFNNKLSYTFNNNVNGNMIDCDINTLPRKIKTNEIYNINKNFVNRRKIFVSKKPEEILKLERKVINFSF